MSNLTISLDAWFQIPANKRPSLKNYVKEMIKKKAQEESKKI